MTFKELENLVLALANKYHCRYWKLWNYPTNTEFAIQVISCPYYDWETIPVGLLENRKDFLRLENDNIYVFRREK